MQKVWKIILVLSLIINLIFGILLFKSSKVDNTEEIDSLSSKIIILQQSKDSIRDSIKTIIIHIKANEDKYKKVRDSIVNNSISNDLLFFKDYLEYNRPRFNNINNSDTVKRD